MDSTLSEMPKQTATAVAISACIIARPGACSAALKGAREFFSYIQANSSRIIGFQRFDLTKKSSLPMMRTDPPPNFWEREYAETQARLEILYSVCVFAKYADQMLQNTKHANKYFAPWCVGWNSSLHYSARILGFGRLPGE
jgi:hypothetical protein